MPYNRHSAVMASEYDSAFRTLVTADVGVDKRTGAVDEPCGHLTMVTIEDSDLIEGKEVFDTLYLAGESIPSAGFYIVHENELGTVVVFRYDCEGDRAADWANAEEENLHWMSEEYEVEA